MPLIHWMLIGAFALLSASCGQAPQGTETVQSNAAEDADFARMVTAGQMLPDLREYLSGSEPAPRTFRFDRLVFERGSSKIRAVDEQTLLALAHTLKGYPKVRVRIVGYDDSAGTNSNRRSLALERANTVAAYLVGTGLEGGIVQPAAGRQSGGNRATELVVLSK